MDKILIVDDESDIIESYIKRFKNEGYDAIGVATKDGAIKKIKEETFDVAIVDMQLSPLEREGGLDVIKELRLKDLSTQIIVLTAYGTLENVYKAMKYGLYQYIDKTMQGVAVIDLVVSETKKALRHKKLFVERFFGRQKEEKPCIKLKYRSSKEIENELLEGLRRFGIPENIITERKLEDASRRKEQRGNLEEILVEMGIEEGYINYILSRQLEKDYVYLSAETTDLRIIQGFPELEDFFRIHCIIPVAKSDDHLTLVMADPTNLQVIEPLKLATGCSEVSTFLGSPENIMEMIDKAFGDIERKSSISKLAVLGV